MRLGMDWGTKVSNQSVVSKMVLIASLDLFSSVKANI